MKSVLISINPKWCEKIVSGKKTIEVRKSAPKEVPFKAYIYCTKTKNKWSLFDYEGAYENSKGEVVYAQQHIIGEFICDKVIRTCGWRLRGDTQQCAKRTADEEAFPNLACLTIDEIVKYAGSEKREVCGWHISDLKIYDKPKKLDEFERPCPYQGNCRSECQKGKFKNDGMLLCSNKITRPPQSYMKVEKL